MFLSKLSAVLIVQVSSSWNTLVDLSFLGVGFCAAVDVFSETTEFGELFRLCLRQLWIPEWDRIISRAFRPRVESLGGAAIFKDPTS